VKPSSAIARKAVEGESGFVPLAAASDRIVFEVNAHRTTVHGYFSLTLFSISSNAFAASGTLVPTATRSMAFFDVFFMFGAAFPSRNI
jgi:hypothetical protein